MTPAEMQHLEAMHQSIHFLLEKEADPEDTLFIALSRPEVMVATLGAALASVHYPCLEAEVEKLLGRFIELMTAQGFAADTGEAA